MSQVNLINIRKDHIIDVFNSVPKLKENASRANIAEYTNLSIMTVGKIIDALIENGIVVQHKEAKDSPGRKAGLLAFNKNKVCRISDYTTYTTVFMDLNLNITNEKEDIFGSGAILPDDESTIANSLTNMNWIYLYSAATGDSLAYDWIYNYKIVYFTDTQLIFYNNEFISKSKISDIDIVKSVINPDYILSNSSEHAHRGMALKLREIWFEKYF